METKSGIWFLDLRESNNEAKALKGWISPTGIMELFAKDISSSNENLKRMSTKFLKDEDGLNLRGYQLKAIQVVENAIIAGQRNWQWRLE